MKLLKLFMVLAMALASATNFTNATFVNEEEMPDDEAESRPFSSFRGINRFLADNNPRGRTPLTCKKNPRICSTTGSLRPHCCKEQCVNVTTDRYNCGWCNKKCKCTEECCRGECVNCATDKRHCGGCNKPCPKGSVCVYGMCNYA